MTEEICRDLGAGTPTAVHARRCVLCGHVQFPPKQSEFASFNLEDIKRELFWQVLVKTEGSLLAAAQIIGVSARGIKNWATKYGLKRPPRGKHFTLGKVHRVPKRAARTDRTGIGGLYKDNDGPNVVGHPHGSS